MAYLTCKLTVYGQYLLLLQVFTNRLLIVIKWVDSHTEIPWSYLIFKLLGPDL